MAKSRSGGKPISKSIAKSKHSSKKNSNKEKKNKVAPQFQYRSNLKCVLTKIDKLALTEEHNDAIRKYCPFRKLVKLVLNKRITIESTMKSDKELANLIGRFNCETKTFDIGGKSLKLTREDVIRGLGVEGGTQEVFTSTDKCVDGSFFENFVGITRLDTTHVSRALEKAVKSEGLAASENVAQLMTMYMLTALFAPTGGSSLCWGYNKILSAVTMLNSYDWPSFIYEKLMLSLETDYKEKVTGCVMLLPYWIMENFPLTQARRENAKLWGEKWDLKKLMDLRKKGPITQMIDTQMTQIASRNNTEKCDDESEDVDNGNDDNGTIGNGDPIGDNEKNVAINSLDVMGTAGGVDLSDDGHEWDDFNILANVHDEVLIGDNEEHVRAIRVKDTLDVKDTNEVVGLSDGGHENVSSKTNMVRILTKENKQLREENKMLKAEQKDRESQNSAFKKQLACFVEKESERLHMKKELNDEIGRKDQYIIQLKQDLLDLQSNLTIKTSESKALRKKLANQGFKVKDLVEVKEKLLEDNVELIGENDKLIEENTELAIQRVTQVAYAEREYADQNSFSSPAFGKRLNFDILNKKTGIPNGIDFVNQASGPNVLLRHELDDTSTKVKKQKIENELSTNLLKSNNKIITSVNENVGLNVEAIKNRVRQEKVKRRSWLYGSEAEGKRTKKQNIKDEARCPPTSRNIPFIDDDFVGPIPGGRITKKLELNIRKFKKMKDALYLTEEQIHKMTVIEAQLGEGCVVVQFDNRKDATILLDDIYEVLDGKMMSNLLINGHAEILKERYKLLEKKNVTIFNSNIWKFMKSMELDDDPDVKNRIEFLDKDLEKAPGVGLYVFSITTNGNMDYMSTSDHWTLLVHNLESPDWKLYNNNKRRGSYDPYKDDAKKLKTYLEIYFRKMWRELYRDNFSDLKVATLDNTQEHTFKLIQPACPQQISGSLDYGTYVCYFMEQLAKGGRVPRQLQYDDLLKYKASLVQSFLDKFDETRLHKDNRR